MRNHKPTRRCFLTAATGATGAIGTIAGCADRFESEACTDRFDADTEVERSIYDARDYILTGELNRGDYWKSPVAEHGDLADVQLTIYYALTVDYLGLNDRSKRAAVEYVAESRPTGSGWNDVATNYAALLLFRRVGPTAYADAVADIKAENDDRELSLVDGGGIDTGDVSIGPFSSAMQTKLFYAVMSDEYRSEELFSSDRFEDIVGILGETPAFRDGVQPDEPFVHPAVADQLLSFLLLGAATTDVPVEELTDASTDDISGPEALEELLLARRLLNGAWAGSNSSTFASLALYEHGRSPSDDVISRPLHWIADQRQADDGRIIIFQLSVWDTVLAMRALATAGIDMDTPVMRRGSQWLLDARTTDPSLIGMDTELDRPPLSLRKHSVDGWGYFPYNVSDWDDTALAIDLLRRYGHELIEPQVQSLLEVQNSDGSWSAFVTDFSPLPSSEQAHARETLGESTYNLLFENHPSPDVTGHVLEALGGVGYSIEDRPIARAVEYLQREQSENGLWLGVWGTGYNYGTNCIVLGLHEIGVEMDRDFVQTAIDALLAEQNPDGGWSDTSEYDLTGTSDAIAYESAESIPIHTGWTLQTLLTAGVSPEQPAIRDAVDYLLAEQRSDGSWEPSKVWYNLGPPRYQLSVTNQAAALRGLAMYAKAVGTSLESRC